MLRKRRQPPPAPGRAPGTAVCKMCAQQVAVQPDGRCLLGHRVTTAETAQSMRVDQPVTAEQSAAPLEAQAGGKPAATPEAPAEEPAVVWLREVSEATAVAEPAVAEPAVAPAAQAEPDGYDAMVAGPVAGPVEDVKSADGSPLTADTRAALDELLAWDESADIESALDADARR